MNRKIDWIPTVDDVQNNGCSDLEREVLLDIFESKTKQMACTSLDVGTYRSLDNCFVAQKNNVKGFNLTMERYSNAGFEQWIGLFEAEGKKMRVFGMLVEPKE
ncbi:MAG: hypothetical protein PHS57_01000 [Alphaproteobacteria bacterium]|nr:hypothetical protein [Alphaproteobacteria bacterium]